MAWPLMLAGCAAGFSETASDYRAKTGVLQSSGSFTVNRSVEAVRASLAQASAKCLSGTSTNSGTYRVSAYGAHNFSEKRAFTTEIAPSAQGVTLTVYKKFLQTTGGGHLLMAKQPDRGFVYAVLDAAQDGGGTKLTYYVPSPSSGSLTAAFKAWAGGSGSDCPDI
ncbi:MAG: hypothetical protein Q7T86_15555 [Hyphomicrobiaceae bacterium]|nr:hypothetical protein [Hyphomicrobiaceae bacterium]